MNSAHGYTEGSEMHQTIDDILNDFLKQQNDSYEDEWYGTDQSICTQVMDTFTKYLNDNNIILVVKEV